jgi:hypothetical protein
LGVGYLEEKRREEKRRLMMYLGFVVNTEHSKLDCESVMLMRLDVESKALSLAHTRI